MSFTSLPRSFVSQREETGLFRQERQDDFFRDRCRISSVEIAKEGSDDLLIRLGCAFRDTEILLPHHAAIADIEDLQSGVTAVACHAEHVEVPFRGYDVLALLHTFDGADMIAQLGGFFEIHRFRRLHHLPRELLYQRGALPFQQVADGLYITVIVDVIDVAAAGRTAEMHVVLQTGTGYLHGTAGADGIVVAKEGQRLTKASHVGEGAEILRPIIAADVPRDEDARPLIIHRDLHIGVGLVITQGDIVLRVQFFDEIALQDQRLHLRPGHRDVEIVRVTDHRSDFRGTVLILSYIGADTVLQVLRLADVDDPPVFVFPTVHPGRVRKGFYLGFDFFIDIDHKRLLRKRIRD